MIPCSGLSVISDLILSVVTGRDSSVLEPSVSDSGISCTSGLLVSASTGSCEPGVTISVVSVVTDVVLSSSDGVS